MSNKVDVLEEAVELARRAELERNARSMQPEPWTNRVTAMLQAAAPLIRKQRDEELVGPKACESLARHLYSWRPEHQGKTVSAVDALWRDEPENVKHRHLVDSRLALRAVLDTLEDS